MRWLRAPFLSFLVFFCCVSTGLGYDRFFRGEAAPSARRFPLIKANFTKLSDESYATYAVNDLRDGNMGYQYVRILLMTSEPYMGFYCRFRNGQQVRANLYEFAENHGYYFGTYYANCKVPNGEKVFGSIQVSEGYSNWLQVPVTYRIEDEHKKIDYKLDYSICVPVLFGTKYTPRRIIEFMELNRILGAKKITIYTDMTTREFNVKKTLQYYANTGFLQVVDFRLPFESYSIHYHGQLAVIADCLMQHTGVAEFVGFHDLDEFIIPMQKKNVLDELRETLTGRVGSLRIPMKFMSSYNMDDAPLITLSAVNYGYLDYTSTKCILRPEMVFEQGIHHTSRVIQHDYYSRGADESKLRVFHMKQRGGSERNNRIAQVYGSELQKNFIQVTKYLGV